MVRTHTTAAGWAAVAAIVLASGCGATPAAPSESSVTGRWKGVAPDGMIVTLNPTGQCPSEFDLEMDLTASGGSVSGTATTRLRKVGLGSCGDVLGRVSTYGLFNGTVASDTISFDFGNNGAYHLSGTFTATRMTGTFVITEFPESGVFVVTRQ